MWREVRKNVEEGEGGRREKYYITTGIKHLT